MLDLTGSYKYFLFNGSVDMRKGLFGLAETVRNEMQQNPIDSNSVYIFMSKNRNMVKLLHFERGFYILYEKRPIMGKFKKPIYDDNTKSYQISWNDMIYFTTITSCPKAQGL
jgi:transposase